MRTSVCCCSSEAVSNHRFVNIKFSGATFCNFCHKKIWFKSGVKCETCELICHKKCTDKCQTQTKCSK